MRLLLVLLVVARVWSTALHTAALRGDEAALLTHFQRLGDGDVDSMDSQQQLTPLHVACLKGHVAAARLLMEHGASVTRVDGRGMSPLHLAALSGSAELAEALLINGAAVDTVETAQNGTALHLAATHAGGCAVASVLLAYGASPARTDAQGNTPAQVAALTGGSPNCFLKHELEGDKLGVVSATAAARAAVGDETTTICLVQFDDRSDLGPLRALVAANAQRCAADDRCVRHTFERADSQVGGGVEEEPMPPFWKKVSLVSALLASSSHADCGVIAWLDSDAVVHSRPSLIADQMLPRFGMIVSRDWPIWGDDAETPFNAGVWAVRNHPTGKALLEQWLGTYPQAAWSRDKDGGWDCDASRAGSSNSSIRSAGSPSTECEWAGEMFEQGAFSRHVLVDASRRGDLRHSSWTFLNSPCVTDEDRRAAAACHFADHLKPLIVHYLSGVAMVDGGLIDRSGRARAALTRGLQQGEAQGLRRLLSTFAAWKEAFPRKLLEARREIAPEIEEEIAREIGGELRGLEGGVEKRNDGPAPPPRPTAAAAAAAAAAARPSQPCVGSNNEKCTLDMNFGGSCRAASCAAHRLLSCRALVGEHAIPEHGFFEPTDEAAMPRLSFLTISPSTSAAALSRHGIEIAESLAAAGGGDAPARGPPALEHAGADAAMRRRCVRAPR